MSGRTSTLARLCLGLEVAGYLALAVVAGVPRSPLTVPLPAGATPPGWTAWLARMTRLDRLDHADLTAISLAVLVAVLALFALVLTEAWAGRVRLPSVLFASAASLGIATAAPMLLSRDVYTYAAYGRIQSVYGHDPYSRTLAAYPHDPFVHVTSAQWLHSHSLYGPLFTLLSSAVAWTWSGSTGGTILAFKLLAGVAMAAAVGLVAVAASRIRPARAPLAVALVGLNPVLVVHTVGGAHVDALIALPLAGAMALAANRPPRASTQALGITLLLTTAFLLKAVLVPALALWLWWVAAGRPGARVVFAHLGAAAGATLAATAPFLTLAPFETLGGLEAWASPSHLVGRAAEAIGGADAARAVKVAFLLLFVALFWRLARRVGRATAFPVGAWGVALLLLPLSLPYLLPWYVAWFAPFLGLMDGTLVVLGAVVSAVLALTLVPADPFHGFTSPGVFDAVHYVAAPVLLAVFALLVLRRWSGRRREPAAPGLLEV